MLLTRQSIFTGNISTMEINATLEQFQSYVAGALIQDAFPNLTPEEREFIMTGASPEEQKSIFSSEED